MIQQRLESLKNEAGKARSDRGMKAREAAVRFERQFGGREFDAQEFSDFVATEPSLQLYPSSYLARKALMVAGTRDDIPQPFQIVRKAKSRWGVEPIERAIFSDQIPDAIATQLKKWDQKINRVLQATDWDKQDHNHAVTAVMFVQNFKHLQNNALSTLNSMADMVALLDEGDLFRLGPATEENDEEPSAE